MTRHRFWVVLLVLWVGLGIAVPSSAADAVDARPGPPGSILVHAEGTWGHTGVPTLRRIERVGEEEIHVLLEGTSEGASAVSSWRFDGVIDALPEGVYRVLVYVSGPGGEPRWLWGAATAEVVGWCRGSFGLDLEGNLLCLHDGRFRVEAWYRLAGGEEQRAHPHPLTVESGAYWFFRDDNLELFLKVLDGCPAFDRWWVFVSGLTDVGVRIEITDTWSGLTWHHATEPGEGFESVRDTEAFATCDAPAPGSLP